MSRADRLVLRIEKRAGKQYAFDRYVRRSGSAKLTGHKGRIIVDDPPYVNPAWRWYHGDNQLISESSQTRGYPDRWFGIPKPPPCAWNPALQLADRFTFVRERAWLTALGPLPHGTLVEMQADMPGWPHLFAFHAFTAAWLALPELEQVVVLDAWEDLNPPAHAWVLPAPPSMSADLEKLAVIPP